MYSDHLSPEHNMFALGGVNEETGGLFLFIISSTCTTTHRAGSLDRFCFFRGTPWSHRKLPQFDAVPLPSSFAAWLSTPSSPLTGAVMFCQPGEQTSEGEERKFTSFFPFTRFQKDFFSYNKEIKQQANTASAMKLDLNCHCHLTAPCDSVH